MHDPSHPVGVLHGRGVPCLPQCCLRVRSVPTVDLIHALSHQEGMISQPKLSHTAEICTEVSCDETESLPVGPSGLIRLGDSYPRPIDWQASDRSHRNLECDPLEEGQEERIAQPIFYGMERCTYVQGDVLHKSLLLLEGILQARVCGMRVLDRHPGHDVH